MRNAAFFFMPSWPHDSHNYTIALFESLTRDSGLLFRGADLNADLYDVVGDSHKYLWDTGNSAEDWYLPEVYASVFQENRAFLNRYFARFIDAETAVCGLSVRNESLPFAYLCAKHIRKTYPDLPIIFGGPACFVESHCTKILSDEWSVTAIVAGEGEHAWVRYLEAIRDRDADALSPPRVPGMVYRLPTGELLDCGPVEKVRNFDSIPGIDYSRLADGNRQSRVYALETSRGCINHCAFCSERNNYFPYRTKSSSRIFQEITAILEHFSRTERPDGPEFPHISFQDSLINGNMQVFEEWMDWVIEAGLRFSWSGMAILRKEMTRPVLEKMRKSGCESIMWGLESGSRNTLRHMNKLRFTPDMAEPIFVAGHAVGIGQKANIIVGFPTETEEDFQESLAYVEKIKPFFAVIGTSAMLVLPNAPVYKNAEQFRIKNPDRIADWVSQDGKNTLSVREERVKRLQAVLKPDQTFTSRKLTEEKPPLE